MGFTAPHTVPPRLALRAYTQSATHFALYNVERLSAWWVVCSRSEGYVSAVHFVMFVVLESLLATLKAPKPSVLQCNHIRA
eukprot:scaffold37161_cov17-Tisochrysis_lutea.AAC.1